MHSSAEANICLQFTSQVIKKVAHGQCCFCITLQHVLQLNDAPLAIVDKRRSSHNVSEVMYLIGDVKDKVAVLVDDMIDTAGTITNAAKASVSACCNTCMRTADAVLSFLYRYSML